MAVAIFAAGLFFLVFPEKFPDTGLERIVNSTATPDEPHMGLPVRLKIMSISVDAPVEPVGLTSQGAMDVPKTFGGLGWFNLGPRPGDVGTSVIDGHFGLLKNGTGSVFDNLDKLRPGDEVIIEDEKGASVSFIVREIRTFDPQADAADVFGTNSGPSHLNLITCEGVWNKTTQTYSQRLVVFTDKK